MGGRSGEGLPCLIHYGVRIFPNPARCRCCDPGCRPVRCPDGRDALVAELQDRIDSLQDQLHVMNQALSSRDNQITELVIVVRQTQAMLPPPAAERKSWWRRFWES